MEQQRIDFAKKSLDKYRRYNDDPYIGFFCLWIGLNVLYAAYQDERKEEWKKVREYFKDSEVVDAIGKKKIKKVLDLITINNHPMLYNYINSHLLELKSYVSDNGDFLNNNADAELGSFLAKVRNNLFHGLKGWEAEKEEQLVSTVNPVLHKTLEFFIRKYSKTITE